MHSGSLSIRDLKLRSPRLRLKTLEGTSGAAGGFFSPGHHATGHLDVAKGAVYSDSAHSEKFGTAKL